MTMSCILRKLGLLIVAALLLGGCQQSTPPTPAATPSASAGPMANVAQGGGLTALGTIWAQRKAGLAFDRGGMVRKVHVELGAAVRAGDMLAEMDTSDLALAVREAEETVALQEALLAQARAGSREQEVAIARAGYEQALAEQEGLLVGARPEEIAVAEAEARAAQARYAQVQAGADPQELIIARAEMDKAEAALRRAQAAYDAVAWQPGVGASPQAALLQDATLDYRATAARYAHLQGLPGRPALEEAKAELARAEAHLELQRAGPAEHQVAAVAAAVAAARARQELAEAGPREEDVAVAAARLRGAQVALERAQVALAGAQLRAPYAGTVSAIHVGPGEWAAQGAPVLEVLDTARWRVETRNVSELSIGRVREGQRALVRAIPFRDMELRGTVVAIAPAAVVQQGDTTYTVWIALDPTDLALRPGMNAEVEIVTE